jgi:hypothetical protein
MDRVTDLAQSNASMTDKALYERDFPAWCELQAHKMRQLAQILTDDSSPDWPRVIEEMEDMGAAERHRVEGLLLQILVHLLKLNVAPDGSNAPHWATEIRAFLVGVHRHYAPSMRQRLDLNAVLSDAIYQIEGRRIAIDCPLSLDELLVPAPDLFTLAARLGRCI